MSDKIGGRVWDFLSTPEEDKWYEAIADALRILRKSWTDDVTPEEDAFILAYADEIAPRPESERE